MADEIEKKYRLSKADYIQLEETLRALGADYKGPSTEENRIFTGRYLVESGAVARIRTTEHGATLTFKRWMQSQDGMKRHIEHETSIGDPEEASEILLGLGLEIRIIYEKRRRTWMVREAEVVLDELPFGLYMEIEGTPDAIREAEMVLEAEGLTPEPETYPRLTERMGRSLGMLTEARF